jgi:hypothetical protein
MLPSFDARVRMSFIRETRVREDRAVPERPRAPLERPWYPADDTPLLDRSTVPLKQLVARCS